MQASAAETIRVLLVEDDPDYYLLTREFLSCSSEPRFQLDWSPTYAEGLEAVARGEHDVYLLDYFLGDRTGLELLRDAIGAGCRAPIILLTGTGGREVDIAAMRLGAADYLVKGKIDAVQLERTIRYSVERSRTMEQLRLFRTAVEQTAEGIVITTAAGRWPASVVVYANPAFGLFSGFELDELTTMSLEPLLETSDDVAAFSRVERNLAKGDPSVAQLAIRRKDGTELVASCHVGPIIDEDGTATHVLALFEDLTERVRLEDELRQAQKMEAIGRLAGGIAHDFNNLLTIVNGFAKVLSGELDEGDHRRRYAIEISRAGERGAELTQHLLAFGRKQVLRPTVLDMNEVATEMAGFLLPLLGEQIEINTVLSPDPAPAEVDGGQIRRVMLNLAVNARDAMPKGGHLELETATVELDHARAEELSVKPGSYVRVSVRDSGVGMDDETIARAFEPFFTTKGGQGTGFGLSTVKGIVEQSSGAITVESEIGDGTTIQIYLPRAAGQPDEQDPHDAVESASSAKATILLVEDDEGVRSVAALVLRSEGYTVLEAGDAKVALDLVARSGDRVDLLITDVVMPGMGGDELARQIVRFRRELPVVFMSGYAGSALDSDALRLEGHFVAKPFDPDELLAVAREALNGAAMGARTAVS